MQTKATAPAAAAHQRRPRPSARRTPQQARCWCWCWCRRDAAAFTAAGAPLCTFHAPAELIAH